MSNTKHRLEDYGSGLLVYGDQDPVTRTPFVVGEKVILCKETNSLISLRSLQGNNYECPYCSNRLNPDFTFSSSVKPPPIKPGLVSPRPSSNNTTLLWGGAVVLLALCFIASALGIFGSLTAIAGTSVPPTYTNTSVIHPPTLVPSQLPQPQPTKTLRPISHPSATSKPLSSCSGVVITSSSSSKGNYLHVDPCSGSDYDLGPLADGTYAVSPNDKFLVYVSAGDGSVYAAKIGDTSLTRLGNLKRDHEFSAFYRNETPSFRLVISGSTVTIYEDVFKQNATYSIPSRISQ